jgi:hypothetical protein
MYLYRWKIQVLLKALKIIKTLHNRLCCVVITIRCYLHYKNKSLEICMAECQLPANWRAYIVYVSTVSIFWIHKYFLIQRFLFNLTPTLYWFYCLTIFHTCLGKQKCTTGYMGGGGGYSLGSCHQLPTMEVWVQSQASPCRICVTQRGSRTGLSRSTAVFSCPYDSTSSLHSFSHESLEAQQLTALKIGV